MLLVLPQKYNISPSLCNKLFVHASIFALSIVILTYAVGVPVFLCVSNRC